MRNIDDIIAIMEEKGWIYKGSVRDEDFKRWILKFYDGEILIACFYPIKD